MANLHGSIDPVAWQNPLHPDQLSSKPIPNWTPLYTAAPVAQQAEAVPTIYVSRGQLENLKPDPEDAAGTYIPVRKTPKGKFTHPLFAAPQQAEAAPTTCTECRNTDSWGIPDQPVCRSCRAGSAWEPLNKSSVNPNKKQQAEAVPEIHDALCPALTGGGCTCTPPAIIDKAWARFCGGIGRGPDAPYPGMIEAFEAHYGQSFTDKDWREETGVWAAAWKAAKVNEEAAAQQAEAVPTDPRPVIEMCAKALAEELAAWDIDPPIHHIKEASDACEAWLAAQGAKT